MSKYEYDYYSGEETEHFRFLPVPKVFFENPEYKDLDFITVFIYSVLHDQVSLSKENGWVDESGRVYVIRTNESIHEKYHISTDKIRNALNQLIDYGLIEKKRRGQGKPDLIYVKNYASRKKEKSISEKNDDCGKYFSETEKTDFLNVEKPISRSGNLRFLEVGKSGPNDTKYNDTKFKDTRSIHQSYTGINSTREGKTDVNDGSMDGLMEKNRDSEIEEYCALIRENIEYDKNMHDLKDQGDRKLFDDFYNVIVDVFAGDTPEYKINGSVYTQAVVKSRMLRLDGDDIYQAIEQYKNVPHKILNPRGYMISLLYNTSFTTNASIVNDVNYSMKGGRDERHHCG